MKDRVAVYTIADPKLLIHAIERGGSGILNEGRPWRKVQQWLIDEPYRKVPLLLGDASVVDGVEWVAVVEQIEIDDAGKTICHFNGLRPLHQRLPLARLKKASDGKWLSVDYIRPYVPCVIDGKTADTVWQALEGMHDGISLSAANCKVRHYVQYHNSDAQGGSPVSSGRGFYISTKKNIKNLIGNRIWLISGQGRNRKQFFLECTFTVDSIKDGDPKLVGGGNGFLFDPPLLLSGLSWFEEFKRLQQNFSLGLRQIDQDTVSELVRISRVFDNEKISAALRFVDNLTVDDYRRAIRDLEKKFTEFHREMLVGHANAEQQSISMQELSRLVGWDDGVSANLQYGRLARMFSVYFGIDDLDNQIQIFARDADERSPADHFQWVLRSPFIDALRKEWPDLILGANDLRRGDDVGDADDFGVRPTQRAALIKARIGQGQYRRRLVDLWQGRCALTGCDIPEALVASHAKPWRLCTNEERLDPYNGLLLAAHVDALFDQGLISFDDFGALLVSEHVSIQQLRLLGIDPSWRLRFLSEKHRRYLSDHRKLIFKSSV